MDTVTQGGQYQYCLSTLLDNFNWDESDQVFNHANNNDNNDNKNKSKTGKWIPSLILTL